MKDHKKLNEYLSNLAVINVKLHNLHWNVVGKQFVQIHEFTESMYNDAFGKFDDVAELIKIQGGKPLVKLSDYLQNSSIKELDKDIFTTGEVLEIVQDDLRKMKDLAIEIRNAADEEGDFETVAQFEGYVAGYNKTLWFIRSMMA